MDELLRQPGTPAVKVLLVDDEPNVLSALRRSLRGRGFEIMFAASAEEALLLLRHESVAVIVSDMRMPGMSGADLLKASIMLAPDAVRVLLTGDADTASAIQAINEGEVFRYLTKPWDDTLLLHVLYEGLARKSMEKERDTLRALAERQNLMLRNHNATLEQQVAERTKELQDKVSELGHLSERLASDLGHTVRLLSSLIENRAGLTARCPRPVTRQVRLIAPGLGISGAELTDLSYASLLQDIGKLSLPDELVRKPLETLDAGSRERVLRHPLVGESSLLALPSLSNAASILGHVNENFDGAGVPGRASGEQIPLASRLLRVVSDYHQYLCGALLAEELSPEQAYRRLRRHRGTRYDPRVVDAFLLAMHQPIGATAHHVLLSSANLKPGMQIAQDLVSSSGTLLLSQGSTLDASCIDHLRRLEALSGDFLWITVAEEPGQPMRVEAK